MLPVTVFLLLLLPGLTYQQELMLECPSGWSHYASHCYKLVDQPMGFNDAARVCHNFGGSLVRIFGYEENTEVAQIVRSVNGDIDEYWIGFTRQYLDDPSDSADASAHWIDQDMEMEEASTSEGFWAPDQPSPADGMCALVEFSTLRYYPVAWTMSECLAPHPFVCEAPAGVAGFSRCANGHYIRDSPDTICDGGDDCGDYSDETHCPDRCRFFSSGESGTISTGGSYNKNDDCTWTLEAPVGQRIMLRFTELNIERNVDFIEILIGGPTIFESTILTRLTGMMTQDENPMYYSSNNYMIVIFRSDSSVQESGFTCEWSTEPQFPGPVVELEAVEDMPQYVTSPSYGSRVGANVRASWIISLPLERRVISLQVMKLDLPDCAFINVYNGADFSSPMLDYITYKHNPQTVISTGNVVSFYYHSCEQEYPEYTGFNISYMGGCHGRIVEHANYLISPGYYAGINYPNFQTCTWLLLSLDYPKKIKMVFRSPFDLQDGVDTLTIYDGLNNTGSPVATLTGNSDQGSYISEDGHFFLVLSTSSIINGIGFKVEWSETCPPPPFNDDTIYPIPLGRDIDDESLIECRPGYEFAQEEHFGQSSVTIVGKVGFWSVIQTPNCERLWCGQAPLIENGYYRNSTGSQYGDQVSYSCYAGYSMITPYNTISCQITGEWEAEPICKATECPQLDNTLINGQVTSSGSPSNDRVYGTVFSYDCNSGFELNGVTKLICQGDGTWSDEVPQCDRVRCPVEMINEVFSVHGVLTPDSNVFFEDTVSAECNNGYQLVGEEDRMISITCMADQMFDSIPECEDIDECIPNDGRGDCDLQCVNTVGSFYCTCDDGYTLATDGTTCIDLNECDEGEVGASYCRQSCNDLDGTYQCECTTPGFILFTENGTEGFSLANNEDGLIYGDEILINHTCVRNRCSDIADPENGRKLTYQTVFNFDDEVHFDCDLGYKLTGGEMTKCEENREWTIDPSTITCEIASCDIPDVTGLQFPPTFDPESGSVPYKSTVDVTCTHARPTPLVFQRQCLYDQTDHSYSLYLNGASAECPVIDCGMPNIPIGSQVVGQVTDTTYNSTFTIECQTMFEQEDDTSIGNGVVICNENGRWDYGTMQCNGAACSDPGTEAGTIQNSPTTYEPGETVTYECANEGFEVDGDTTLECVVSGSSPQWNGSPPTCKDTTSPAIVHTDCGKAVEIERLQPTNIQLPTVTDNTGATAISGITLTQDEYSSSQAQYIAINEPHTLTYIATDFAGNTDSCTIQVNIKDHVAPTITCPASYILEIDTEEPTVYNIPTGGKEVVATDNVGQPTVTYSPNSVELNGSTIDTWVVIRATATDDAGNEASCQYMIYIQAKSCRTFSERDPVNGQRSCEFLAVPVVLCTDSCNDGFYNYDQSDDTSLVSELVTTCPALVSFSYFDAYHCVVPELSEFYIGFKLNYSANSGSNSPGCLQELSDVLDTALIPVEQFLQQKCQSDLGNNEATVTLSKRPYEFEYYDTTTTLAANVYFKLGPRTLSQLERDTCRSNFEHQFMGFFDDAFDDLRQIDSTASCPGLELPLEAVRSIDLDPDTDSYGEFLCAESTPPLVKSARNTTDPSNIQYFCFPCPPGTFYDGSVCTECAVGYYQPASGSTECMECPGLTSTFSTGSATEDYCVATCENQPGFASHNNLPPCFECPKNTYSSYDGQNSTCMDCPTGRATDGTGSTKEDDCKEPCPPGLYSDTGYMDCINCPENFYQPLPGQTTCMECASDQITYPDIPYTSAADCQDGVVNLCDVGQCENGGTCSVKNHQLWCDCAEGYTGVYCETQINFCASNPCYYGGDCTQVVGGFSCDCPVDYSGTRCESSPDFCSQVVCENGGMCKNTGTSAECLCPTGYQGETCENTEDICVADPCGDHGSCRVITARRRVCDCDDGWTDDTCETNTNECSSNPCLYGFECTDGDDDYSCACTGGFSGKNCESRPENICGNNPCQETGTCFDDYRENGFVCICNEGYSGSATSMENTWLSNIAASTKLNVNGSCDLIDYCTGASNKCEENGTEDCMSTLSGPYCMCKTGFSGSKCQHNIDDCADKPCVHGTCEDGFNSYTCDCDFGYTGSNCESDIVDCDPLDYPCNVTGTDTSQGNNGCEDKVGDYECFCKPGYTGKDCENEIDECLRFPCSHGGMCNDLVNDFECSCPEGWEGKTCEEPSSYCGSDTCENDAECLSLFGDYFCQCTYPYYGEKCELEASTCRDANPCVEEGSECLDAPDGTAICTCSVDFVGEGCQLRKNQCEDENYCLNGGTCRQSMELDQFDCDCSSDFSGPRCEERVGNLCDSVNCANGGECIPVRGDYICRCPPGLDGPDCDKIVDPLWDICFYDSEEMGMAYKMYAIPLGSDLDTFSIGLWMKFTEYKGEGTFFTLYGLDYQNINTPREKLLELDSEGAHFHISQIVETLDWNFGLYDINDRSWYYIMVTWVKDTGKLELFVNSAKVHTMEGYATGEDLPDYAMIVLGSELEDDQASELTPEEGSGFHGCVSHVFGWDVALDFNTEVQAMADSRMNLVRQENLILDWKKYLTINGAYIAVPSTAGDAVCQLGFTGEDCDEVLPDKEPPSIEDCPDVVYETQGVNRITQVYWEEPEFEGHSGEPVSTYRPGGVFIWGKYPTVYVARDAAGNAAVCAFDIYVRQDDCESPEAPENGSASCSDVQGDSSWPSRTCSATCNSGTFSIPVPSFYSCGPQGNFPTNHMFQTSFEYPSCAVSTPRLVQVRLVLTYLNIQACDDLIVVAAFKTPILQRLQHLDGIWKNMGTTVSGFCHNQNCADVISITTVCESLSISRRRRRQAEVSNVIVTITIQDLLDLLENGNDIQTPIEVLISDILDMNGFDLDGSIAGAVVDEPSLILTTEPICMSGQVLIGSECVDCGPGTFYDNVTKTCVECPIGQFQAQAGQESCQMCEDGETTETVGSKDGGDCYISCPAGSYYHLGLGSCKLCEIGFYQSETGKFFCWPCEADETTPGNGTIGEDGCYEFCPDGTELTGLGQCQACEIGYYRTAGIHVRCTMCDPGFVTAQAGSVAEADCSRPDCQVGEKIVGLGCEVCPIGTFQNVKWQDSCRDCPTNKTTLQNSSTDITQCLFFCPMGEEEDLAEASTCRECAQGFYKDNALPGERCVACPDEDFVTPGTGATSDDSCTVLSCDPGQKANADQSACIPCEIGSYQPEPYKDMCIPCEGNTSTRVEGADEEGDCEEYCPAGTQNDGTDSCLPCPIGYFRNTDGEDKFTMCERCDEDFITATVGATDETECNIANCTAGQYRDVNDNSCKLCPKGEYQPTWWQTSCMACDEDGHKTTDGMGAVSEDECRLECQAGYQDPGTEECQKCPVGYYKQGVGAAQCTMCENGQITDGEGATSSAQCTVANCSAGTYRDSVDNVCVSCPRGTFGDRMWQEDGCQSCDGDLTTIGIGSDDSSDCITNCDSGSGYDLDEGRCEVCPRGYYRTQGVEDVCEMCDGEYITQNPGAQSSADCTIRNCSAGTYRSSDNMCVPCPRGEYQPNKWGTSCIECDSGYSTTDTGSTSEDDCLRDCPLGEEYNILTDCEICPRGKFRDATSLFCQDCDSGTTTIETGSVSKDDCSIGFCSAGRYPDGLNCMPCGVGTYQNKEGSVQCIPCPGHSENVTSPEGATSSDQCQSTDECALGTHQCLSEAQGGLCEDSPGVGYRCSCRSAWEGTHPSCTHKCELDYCQNGGRCVGAGTDSVSCDCSDVGFDGDLCETETKKTSYTNAIIGGAVGGGVGLILILLIILCCCLAFRSSEPAEKMPPPTVIAAPTPFVYNSMPTGMILKQNPAPSTLGNVYFTGDRQSLPGYNRNSGSQYMFYDEGESGAVNTFGGGAANNGFSNGTINFENDM